MRESPLLFLFGKRFDESSSFCQRNFVSVEFVKAFFCLFFWKCADNMTDNENIIQNVIICCIKGSLYTFVLDLKMILTAVRIMKKRESCIKLFLCIYIMLIEFHYLIWFNKAVPDLSVERPSWTHSLRRSSMPLLETCDKLSSSFVLQGKQSAQQGLMRFWR